MTSSATPYAERLDGTISNPAAPTPGAATTNWSARWFGAIWLQAGGAYNFSLTGVVGACRLWVGKTKFGDQIIDDWTSFGASHTAGPSPYTPAASGWYPIVLEYGHDTGAAGITLAFTPPNIGNYTDPGGTTITANGSTSTTIPATSLSPLGCVDQRFQGRSHYDIVKQTATDFGYQLAAEPMQLESGEFPCRLAPRLREGRDTDVILEAEDRGQTEGILDYEAGLDAADQVSTLHGTGAGIADGKSTQIWSEGVDVPTLTASLFDMQGWTDAQDVAFPALLTARVNTQLGLQLTPWQNVVGRPFGRDRMADSFPLTGNLAAMRWRPGDGVRLALLDVNVFDSTPRQMLQFTREFGPEGRTNAQAGFRQRPRAGIQVVRKGIQAALASSRSYQKQYVVLPSTYVNQSVAAGGTSSSTSSPLMPQDQIVKATLRILQNSAAQSLAVLINGTDQTSNLGGPWTGTPVEIDVTAFAQMVTSGPEWLFYAQAKNNGASTTVIDLALVVTVLR